MTSTLDSDCQATLMMCTSSRNSSGEDLASFRNKTAKLGNILVIDVIRFVKLFCGPCDHRGDYLSPVCLPLRKPPYLSRC